MKICHSLVSDTTNFEITGGKCYVETFNMPFTLILIHCIRPLWTVDK